MTHQPPTRRQILKAAAALPLAAALPGVARAAVVPGDRRFLFLLASGGWDSTLVFEPPRQAGSLDVPTGSRTAAAGGLRWTSAPRRPSVDRFFRKWGDRVAVVNGMHVPTLGHAAATRLLLSGDAAPGRPDWPTLLARAAEPVKARQTGASSFADSLSQAVEPLRSGRSRCELLDVPGTWDTHFDNAPQCGQFETLFHGLDGLFDHASRLAGRRAPRLLDELVVVALSELGRTPRLNEAGGKHHWPFTSALIAGAGVAGGRVFGATDAGLEGKPVDFRTGLPAGSGDLIRSENLGATLLQIGGLSPRQHLPGVPVLGGLLA